MTTTVGAASVAEPEVHHRLRRTAAATPSETAARC